LKPQFQDILAAAKQIIATNQTEDLTFIIKFVSSDNIQTIQDLSSDKAALINGLTGIKLEGGQTALIDALYVAAEYAVKNQNQAGKRHFALVLLSDGEDRASYFKESDLFTLLHKNDLQVFVIGLIGQLDDEGGFIRKSPRRKANELLMKLAQETGGRAFILNSPKELGNAINQLTMSLHSQYVIRYQPTKNPDRVRGKARVKLVDSPKHEKWKVITGRVSVSRN
jgi:VWFA-related protein